MGSQGRGGSGTLHFLLDHEKNDGMLHFMLDPTVLGLHPHKGTWHIPAGISASRELTWPVRVWKRFTCVNLGNIAMRIHSAWLVPVKVRGSRASPLPPAPSACAVSIFVLL